MTLARELSESNGKLLQRPVHEAESLRQQHQSVSPRTISNKYVLQENAQAVEIQLQWALKNSDAEHYGLQLGTGMRLYIDNQSERLVLWRYYPHENLDGYRSIPLPQRDTLALRIFIDTSSVEVFNLSAARRTGTVALCLPRSGCAATWSTLATGLT